MVTKTIEQTQRFAAKPVQVYDEYLNPLKYAEFTGVPATGGNQVGTAYDGYIMGRHLELVPARKIVDKWQTTEWPEGYEPSLLELSLVADGDGTLLTMVHSNVLAEQAEAYRKGWSDY